jgi:hypothetical protein
MAPRAWKAARGAAAPGRNGVGRTGGVVKKVLGWGFGGWTRREDPAARCEKAACALGGGSLGETSLGLGTGTAAGWGSRRRVWPAGSDKSGQRGGVVAGGKRRVWPARRRGGRQ